MGSFVIVGTQGERRTTFFCGYGNQKEHSEDQSKSDYLPISEHLQYPGGKVNHFQGMDTELLPV